MEIDKKGLELIKSFEGCRLTAYKCVSSEKYYTIGYGHYGADVSKGMTITQEKADKLLKSDIAKFENAVNNSVKVEITQSMFNALVSFCYNIG
jgi:GH24 family phage-related lysozyme (muramidase)